MSPQKGQCSLYSISTANLSWPWLSHIGTKLNQARGLIAERLFIDEEEVNNSPKQMFGEYGAGDIKYKDINKDGIINANDMGRAFCK